MLLSPTNATAFRRDACSRRSACGFTLIELLTVIAIIGILAAITLNVATGVKTRAAISQAKAELSVLSNALEGYKRQYGDYPQTGVTQSTAALGSGPGTGTAEAELFNALTGKLGPTLQPITAGGKNFLELAKFTLEVPYGEGTTGAQNTALLDPWGNRYHYFYKTANSTGSWTGFGYVLYSSGPDGKDNPPANTGVIDTTDAKNTDNIYANQN